MQALSEIACAEHASSAQAGHPEASWIGDRCNVQLLSISLEQALKGLACLGETLVQPSLELNGSRLCSMADRPVDGRAGSLPDVLSRPRAQELKEAARVCCTQVQTTGR